MADRLPADSAPSLTSLVGGIVTDVQQLVRQEITLARSEMQQEWEKTKTAAGSMAVGAGLLLFGGVLLCFTVVYVLVEVALLPHWASFLIVGGVLSVLGAVLLYAGVHKADEVHLVPQQTAETVKELVTGEPPALVPGQPAETKKENAQWTQNRT